jgi:hypothetical protein
LPDASQADLEWMGRPESVPAKATANKTVSVTLRYDTDIR